MSRNYGGCVGRPSSAFPARRLTSPHRSGGNVVPDCRPVDDFSILSRGDITACVLEVFPRAFNFGKCFFQPLSFQKKAATSSLASRVHLADDVHVLDPRLRHAGMTEQVASHKALAMSCCFGLLRAAGLCVSTIKMLSNSALQTSLLPAREPLLSGIADRPQESRGIVRCSPRRLMRSPPLSSL